jgi:twinfilin
MLMLVRLQAAESIVLESITPVKDDFSADLEMLQDVLEDAIPAYVLAKLDGTPSQWLAITYVPDAAKVRDKVCVCVSIIARTPQRPLSQMLYASTRAALTKALGSAAFPDALFATHKSDLTPTAYAAHRRHQTAPKPLSAREQEMADVQAAERAAARISGDGSSTRRTHLGGSRVEMDWSENLENAVTALASLDEGSRLVVLSIDPATETLLLLSDVECAPNNVGASLPPSDPCEMS